MQARYGQAESVNDKEAPGIEEKSSELLLLLSF